METQQMRCPAHVLQICSIMSSFLEEAEEGHQAAAARDICQRLTLMSGRAPSVSAIADGKLVERFLGESVGLTGDTEVVQLYIASFWGFSDTVGSLLDSGADVNHANPGTLWTPLHAATFQEHGKVVCLFEHGKVVMVLLERGANPDQKDSEGRSPKDFASASVKIWPHFAALGFSRLSKDDLIAKGIIKKACSSHPEPKITRKSVYTRSGSECVIQNPNAAVQRRKLHMSSAAMAACLSGDVLASDTEQT